MQNPITKAARYLRREYPFMTLSTGVGTGIGAAVGTAVAGIAGAAFFVVPIAAAVMGGGMLLMSFPSGGEHNRPKGNTVALNGVKLVGNKRDVASIFMTQKLISDYTEKMQHLPELPARTMRKIAAHLFDIRGSLARVRAYGEAGEALTSFSFTRKMVDEQGQQIDQPLVTCNLPLTAQPLPAAPQPVVIGAPQPLAALPAPTADFTAAVEAPQPETVEAKAPVNKPGLKL